MVRLSYHLTTCWHLLNHNNKTITKLTSFGLFLRYCTVYRLNSSCGIVAPLTRCNCSDSAWNMQFPEPSLSEIMKPLSDAILSKFSNRASLSQVLSASHCICWRFLSNCPYISKNETFCFKNHSLFVFSLANTCSDVWCMKHQTKNVNTFACFMTQLYQKSMYWKL